MKAEQIHENRDQAALYFNRREDYFLITAIAKQGYGSVEVGEPIKLAGLELDSRIMQVLSQVLDSFGSNSPQDSIPRTPDEYRAFRKKHLSVSVERNHSSGELRIMPLHRIQGGYAGKRAEEIVLSAEAVPTKLPAAIREAFDIAS